MLLRNACWWSVDASKRDRQIGNQEQARSDGRVVEAMWCRDEGGTRIELGLEGVVNLYRRTGLGFGRQVHVEGYSAGHPGTPEHGRGAGWM